MDEWDESSLGMNRPSTEGRGRPRILVAEGESIVALDINMLLQSAGPVETAFARSGEEALEKAEDFKPDLLLMDASLRGKVSGLEAAEMILKRFGIPVVCMVSSLHSLERGPSGRQASFRYLAKPFEHEELIDAVKASLEAL